jgi:hypothetical protein
MNKTIFWDVILCDPLEVQRRFGRMYCFHLQDRRVCQGRSRQDGERYTIQDQN